MRNIFSASEEIPEVDPAFAAQAAQQRGGLPQAPPTDASLPEPAPVAVAPVIESIAEVAAPHSALEDGR